MKVLQPFFSTRAPQKRFPTVEALALISVSMAIVRQASREARAKEKADSNGILGVLREASRFRVYYKVPENNFEFLIPRILICS